MRTLVEITTEKDETTDEGLPQFERSKWFLLHWGLKYTIVYDENKSVPINFTVAICQNLETGQVDCFLPEQLRIIGTEIKI